MAAEGLRRATPEDEAAVRALVLETFGGYAELIGRTPLPILADHASLIANGDAWVLEDESGIHGVLEMVLKEDSLYIDTVAVSVARQGQGLGGRLLGFAETRARALGLDALTLLTNERYTHLLAMYAKLGYRETHREPYQGTDIVHFRKSLLPASSGVR